MSSLTDRLRRYSQLVITNALDPDFANAVWEAADRIELTEGQPSVGRIAGPAIKIVKDGFWYASSYIEREELINAMNNMCNRVCDYSPAQRYFMCGSCTLGSAFDLVEEFPAADVQPVKHGRWIQLNQNAEPTALKCSLCGEISCCRGMYCPDCGAKMDGEE